jgi:ribonuclease HI
MTQMLTIYADGGCSGNHQKNKNKREAYCSIMVEADGRAIKINPDWVLAMTGYVVPEARHILSLGNSQAKTSPESEFHAAILATSYIRELINRNHGRHLPKVTVKMDSRLVIDGMNGAAKIKAENLVPLFNIVKTFITEARTRTDIFFEWMHNEDMKALIGH